MAFCLWLVLLALVSATGSQQVSTDAFFDDFSSFNASRWYLMNGTDGPTWTPCTYYLPIPELVEFGSPDANGGLELRVDNAPCMQSPNPCAPCKIAAGSVRSLNKYLYGNFSCRLRAMHNGAEHANNQTYAFFNIYEQVQTINVQFSTRVPVGQIHLAYEGANTLHHDQDITTGFDPFMTFNDYTVVWLPNELSFWVNGKLVWTATEDVPNVPLSIDFLVRVATPEGAYEGPAQIDVAWASYEPYSPS